MILTRVLHHDLHKSDNPNIFIPWIEYSHFHTLPVIVSSSRGKFLTARRFHANNIIRAGTFNYDSDQIDNVLDDMFTSAMTLSKEEKWGNVFSGKSAASNAFDYILDEDNFGQPHACLVPHAWTDDEKFAFFGKRNIVNHVRYKKYCRIYPAEVSFPIFCSRPDMVGLYTQFVGGTHSIVLHNIKMGLAFCPTE